MTDKKTIFTNFNRAKARAKFQKITGRRPVYARGEYDTGRANRSLGVAQLKNERPYRTTVWDCDCPDRKYRKVVCKHMLAKRYEAGWYEPKPEPKRENLDARYAGLTSEERERKILEELGF